MANQIAKLYGESFVREDAKSISNHLQKLFREHFKSYGSYETKPELITSGFDPTVRFIGSHISILKDYFEDKHLKPKGTYIIQNCVRTHGLKHLLDDIVFSHWGSFFVSLGVLVPYTELHAITNETLSFLSSTLGVPMDQLIIRVNSRDKDLLNASLASIDSRQLEIDTMPDKYYQHKIGMNNVFGRNFNIAIKNSVDGTIADVGNIIVLEKDGFPHCVEVALGSSTILKQIFNLDHVQDCHPLPCLNHSNKTWVRKFEDTVILSMHLMHEGLTPSNKDNRTRILKKYLDSMKRIKSMLQLDDNFFANYLQSFESDEFEGGSNELSQAILDYISSK